MVWALWEAGGQASVVEGGLNGKPLSALETSRHYWSVRPVEVVSEV